MIIWKNISTLLMIDRSYKFFSRYNEYSHTEVMKVLKRDIRPISQVDSFSYIYIYTRIVPGRTITMNGSCRTEYSSFQHKA